MESLATMETNLQVLDQREAELHELAKLGSLKIAGLDDKEGYKLVRESRIKLKNARVGVEKDAKSLRDPLTKLQRTISAREDDLLAIIDNAESSLEQEEDRYLELKRIEDERIEREEDARIQARVDALAKFGYAIDLYEAKIMPEENFQALLGQAEAEYLKEQERIAAEKAESERVKREEEERLHREREELTRQRAEQDAREKELQRQEAERLEMVRKQEEATRKENERIRKEQEAKEAQLRADREAIESEKRAFESRKQEEEKERQRLIAQEKAVKEAAEKARLEEQQRAEREANERANAERRAQEEAARQEALKPDKEKIAEHLSRIEFTLSSNDVKSQAARDLVKEASEAISDLIADLQEKVRTL